MHKEEESVCVQVKDGGGGGGGDHISESLLILMF